MVAVKCIVMTATLAGRGAIEDLSRQPGGIAHFDADDQMALVAVFAPMQPVPIGDDEAMMPTVGAVVSQHGVDIDIGIGQDRRHRAGALVVFRKD